MSEETPEQILQRMKLRGITGPVDLDRSERDVIGLALAHLAVERPGWHPACLQPLAEKLDVLVSYEETRSRKAEQP